MKTEYDYIIVGAGSSGCVLANRLSADPDVSVCLIEAGSHDNSLRIQTPAGTITLYKSKKYSWNFFSAPQKHLNGRSLHTPRGKALGGSSSMNSMIYIRGHASDYDRWAQAGCAGWDWDSVLPYFRKSENNRLGQDPRLHGTAGELNVEAARDPNPVSRLFIKAAQRIGIPLNDDFNGETLEGCGLYNLTQKNARRLSSYRAFVAPVLERSNLTVITDCSVQALMLQQGVAKGVKVVSDGKTILLGSSREVILSAGSLGSPSLLLASGIGPASELEKAGIKVEHDLPGVGKNLQDHLDGLITVRSKSPLTLGFSLGSLPSIVLSPLRYVLRRKGWLTTNYVEAGGFARTPLANALPDVQFHFVPGYRSHRGRLFEWGHGYAVHTCVLRPRSIGEIRLDSAAKPVIDFNFLSDPEDARVLIEGLKLARRILADQPFDGIRGKEMLPGAHVQTDEQLMTYVREYAATVFHPVGTCKMGVDAMSVVGPDLKVHGIQGLRVVDASIMPTLISGNTNAPCIMIGEKAADLIRCRSTAS
ncbi:MULTISPECIES: GMC family oxidoreductase [unclassified Pseudomonas]|uniref:GMC family oxidoreductase n=1 Tax=unclassified Pseudomonas TaxID=196821 RepID=UPI000538BA3A|nr:MULTISPECIES: GMC family oxidoreductase N-terminal domain-containing protein [unclassified Pseudomonas]MBD0686593.1 alcohol dehydrogenase [Pseudomonas sp. PSB18]CDF95138.1 Choline dehydrogenase [Pseudomonas sp. SHC52]